MKERLVELARTAPTPMQARNALREYLQARILSAEQVDLPNGGRAVSSLPPVEWRGLCYCAWGTHLVALPACWPRNR